MPGLVGQPTWSEGGRGRVLVEAAEWSQRETIARALRHEGYSTVACPGPAGSDERCSLAAGHGCGAAEQADVVVHTLRSSDPRNLEVLRALRRRLPETPLVVEVPEPVLQQHPDEYQGCTVVPAPMTTEALLDAVDHVRAALIGAHVPEPGILTVTVNPAIDVGLTVEYLVPDHKLVALEHRRDPGGGGVNVSRVLRRLDLDSSAWVAVGGPTGGELVSLLHSHDIRTVVHEVDAATRESIAITDQKRHQQYRIVLPGPDLEQPDELVDEIVGHASAVDVLVLSGSLPPSLPAGFYASICAELPSTTTVVDTKGDGLAAVVAGRADIVKPSRRELASLVDWVPASEREIETAARSVLERGRVGALAVSLGGDGAVLVPRDARSTWYEPPDVEVESTVGSGDAMVAGIVAGLGLGESLGDAVRRGVAAGSATVTTPGTDLCYPDDVERLLPQVGLRARPTGAR